MYKIDLKRLTNELKYKKKHLFIEFVLAVVVNVILFVVYFIVTKKNNYVGIASIVVSILTVIFLVLTIKEVISIKKCIKDAKYLSNNGTLLKKQKINIKSFLLFSKPCLYYVDSTYKIKKLKLRHAINLFNTASFDLLIDLKNPKRYYIDSEIKTTNNFDLESNNKPFKDKINYPGYINVLIDKNLQINNIITFLLLIAFFIYVGIVKDDAIVRGATIGASFILAIEIFKSISKTIELDKKEKSIKILLKKGKLYSNLKFKIDKKDDKAKQVTVKVNHNDKELISDKIKYLPEKDKVNLLIDEKSNNYIIDYDINRIDKINN